MEALAVLVAARSWTDRWQTVRAAIEVQSDNTSALATIYKPKGRIFGVNAVAHELALDLCDGSVEPDVCLRVPGVASTLADALSRLYQPGAARAAPPQLREVPRVQCKDRRRAWCRAADI